MGWTTPSITNGTVFACAMNNYWYTNYKVGQDGKITLRYSLTSEKHITPAAASRHGEAAVAPMRTILLPPGRKSPDLPPRKSSCRIDPENVTLTALKPADDGHGLIVRLRETAGRDTMVTITVGFHGVSKATRCDLIERTAGPADLDQNRVTLEIGAYSMAAVRLE